ncbi:hypothetical protein CF326_g9727 [Tilletia indica]|nr:hypothetical protein CF326_g9727 [Tilletia indica]
MTVSLPVHTGNAIHNELELIQGQEGHHRFRGPPMPSVASVLPPSTQAHSFFRRPAPWSSQLDSRFESINLFTFITRARFEALGGNLFSLTIEPVERVSVTSGSSRPSSPTLSLSVDSMHVPHDQKLLRDFFTGRESNTSIYPDEAVAYGTAVKAATLSGDPSETTQALLLLAVAPLSSVWRLSAASSPLSSSASPLPSPRRLIQIYASERARSSAIKLLSSVELSAVTHFLSSSPNAVRVSSFSPLSAHSLPFHND